MQWWWCVEGCSRSFQCLELCILNIYQAEFSGLRCELGFVEFTVSRMHSRTIYFTFEQILRIEVQFYDGCCSHYKNIREAMDEINLTGFKLSHSYLIYDVLCIECFRETRSVVDWAKEGF